MRRLAWLGMGLGAVVLLVLGSVLLHQTATVTRSVHVVLSELDPAAAQVAVLGVAISDMQRGVSNYLLTGQEAALAPYLDGSQKSASALANLDTLLLDHDTLAAAAQDVAESRRIWIETVAEPTVGLAQAGDRQSALDLYTSAAASASYLALQSDTGQLRDALETAAIAAFRELSDVTLTLIRTVLVALILLGAALLAGFALATNLVVRPLTDLRVQIRQAAQDSRHTHSITSAGPRELRSVGADVEALRRQLVSEIDESRSAREALDQQAPVVTAIRRELAAGEPVSAPGLSIYGELRPAEGVLAGDWWATARLPTGEVAVMVADISGHGAHAGIAAMRLKHSIRLDLGAGKDIADIARSAADVFREYPDRFATVAAVCVDPASGRIRYLNAGHHEPLLINAAGEVVERLATTGPILSWIGGDWKVGESRLPHGGSVLLYSDGLIESHDAHGVELGEDLLVEWVEALSAEQREPRAMVEWLLGTARHRSVDWNRDDVTAVVVQRSPRPPPTPTLPDPAQVRRRW